MTFTIRQASLSFSPVAGIQWVETCGKGLDLALINRFQSRCRDSVG